MRKLGPFFGDIWRLTRPYFLQSDERVFAWGMMALNIGLRFSLVGFDVVFNYWNRAFFDALQVKDWGAFLALFFTYRRLSDGTLMPGFVSLAIVAVAISIVRVYLVQWLQIRWRRWMTSRMITEWLSDRAYYRVSLFSGGDAKGLGTDNPDQRIADDLRDFIGDAVINPQGVLFFFVDFISNIVELFSFLFILWRLSGSVTLLGLVIPGYMVWVALIYSAGGTWLTHLVGKPLAFLSFQKQRAEADFRFGLMRLRENTESVALYGGEAPEMGNLKNRFGAIVGNWWQLMRRFVFLNALTSGYGQVAGVFPLIVAAPRYFFGKMPLGFVTQVGDAFGQVQGAMSWLVNNYQALAAWAATVERLATFQRAIAAAHAAAGQGITAEGALSESGFALRDATIALPNGEVLLAHSNLTLRPGQSVVISGRSGTGKSTLFRAFAGIWPFGSGHVQRPAGQRALFLPQRAYMPLGSLRHALSYPDEEFAYDDAAVRQAMADVHLDHLIDRLGDEDDWTQRLSGGELQRLAIARALLARPEWLFLDEATANLDPEAEAEVYAIIKTRLPGTTVVSIAHRPEVARWHDKHLRFERPPGRIVAADGPAAHAAD
jgi:putative ATP-binding cassette transporter